MPPTIKGGEGKDVDIFASLWHQLTPTQKRFAVAMQEHPSKKDAAAAIGIAPRTAYNWNGVVNDVLDLMQDKVALATLGIIQANATKAAMVKAAGLDSADEKVAQQAATEIIDRNLGKPTQRQEISGKDGDTLKVEYVNDWRQVKD